MILAGEIGATKTHLAVYDWVDERVDPTYEESYWSQDYDSFDEIVTEFLAEARGSGDEQEPDESREEDEGSEARSDARAPNLAAEISAACLGVPGAVAKNTCTSTALPWAVNGDALGERFGVATVRLLPAIEATAHGLLALGADEVESLTPAVSRRSSQTCVVLDVDSALVEAIMFWDGQRHSVCPSQGALADFGPSNDAEIELLRYLRASYLHVSYDRVLSAPGIHATYQFLRDTKKNEPTWFAETLPTGEPATLIAEAAVNGKPDICTQTINMFLSMLGAEAGNFALKAQAVGGVYLSGRLVRMIRPLFNDGAFMKAFVAKGRAKRWLSSLPVHVIVSPHPAMVGAAVVAAQRVQEV